MGDRAQKKATDEKPSPKKAMNAFFHFCNETRQELKDLHPDKSLVEISRLLGLMWGGKSTDERAPFVKMADADKAC